jgi:prevent-host-death family protein
MEHDKHVTAGEARGNFRELLNDVEAGEAHVVITRHGKPSAVIVPVGWHEDMKALISGKEVTV